MVGHPFTITDLSPIRSEMVTVHLTWKRVPIKGNAKIAEAPFTLILPVSMGFCEPRVLSVTVFDQPGERINLDIPTRPLQCLGVLGFDRSSAGGAVSVSMSPFAVQKPGPYSCGVPVLSSIAGLACDRMWRF